MTTLRCRRAVVGAGCAVDRAVFINYRGEDSHSYGALLYTELARQFGDDQVFLDVESIPAGVDFVEELLDRVRSAWVLLAVIGPRWLTATDPAGQRRIDDPADWIHRELAEAFTAGVRVIPVLTDQAELPTTAQLPADLVALSRCQYRQLRYREPTADLARIVTDLASVDSSLATAARRRAGAPLEQRPLTAMVSSRWWPTPVPRQLPLTVPDFVGRVEQLALLDALLPDTDTRNRRGSTDGPGAVVISAVDGSGGVGKTTLAVHWARRVEHQFPDGTLFVNLRGYGPGEPMSPGEALDGLLGALGVPGEAIPTSIDAQAGLYRSMLAARRLLIVLDNANTSGQVRPLLPASPGCLVIVTSRASLTGLVIATAARRVTLDLMNPREALDLLHGLIGAARVDAEPAAVNDLMRLCARLPLALRIVAAQAAEHTAAPLADLVVELADDRHRLDLLSRSEDEEFSVRAVFDGSYRRLSIEQGRLFRLLGLHPGPDIGLHAVAALAGVDLLMARRLMTALAAAHLIEPAGHDRYRLHDLLRAYAADHVEQDHDPTDRDSAARRLIEWYAHHATAACAIEFPWFVIEPLWDAVPSGQPEIKFADREVAAAWQEAEQGSLIAILRWAASNFDLPRLTMLLRRTVGPLLSFRGNMAEIIDACQAALAMTRRSGAREVEADLLADLAELLLVAPDRRLDEASAAAHHALALAQHLPPSYIQPSALNTLARVCLFQRRYNEAVGYLQCALPLSVGYQCGRLEGVIEGNLSEAQSRLGDYERAIQHARREHVLRRRAGDHAVDGMVSLHMALVRQGQGAHHEVISICGPAIALLERPQILPSLVAQLLDAMAVSLNALGERVDALDYWRRAVAVFDLYDYPRAAQIRDHIHGLDHPAYWERQSDG